MISKALNILKNHGVIGTLKVVRNKLFRERAENYKRYRYYLKGKSGIEIGGPSPFFNNQLPIYSVINSCDGVNFNSSTVWEGEIKEGENYSYLNFKLGYQFICDAVELKQIPDNKYEFVLSCNNLEHIANPLKAVKEWLRVLKKDGLLLLVLPFKESNFDHKREYTNFNHLLEDFNNNIKEDDLTHLDEILKLHDLSLDKEAGTFEEFKARSFKNFENRCLHHHVFSDSLLKEIYKHFNLEVLMCQHTSRDIVILGRKQ